MRVVSTRQINLPGYWAIESRNDTVQFHFRVLENCLVETFSQVHDIHAKGINLMLQRAFFTSALLMLATVLPALAQAQSATDSSTHPNILFIAIDDMNDWAGFLDTHPQIQTPNMDTLATQGVSFTNAHVPAPICGPSRTAIMSGLWPTSNGIYTNAINYRRQMPHLVSLP